MLLPPYRRIPSVCCGQRAIKRVGAEEIIMAFRYTLIGAVTLALTSVVGAQAQSPFPPVGQEQRSPFPPVGQEQRSPFPPAGQQSPFPPAQQSSPCMDQFVPLRQEV